MINRLVAMGLVTKESHPQDARLNVLKITDKVRELHPEIQQTVLNLERAIESQMGASNLQTFIDQLATFLELEF